MLSPQLPLRGASLDENNALASDPFKSTLYIISTSHCSCSKVPLTDQTEGFLRRQAYRL